MIRDLLHAWRGLTDRPGFFIALLLTLAIGIGANVTIFSLVNAIALRPMPFGDRTDRLVTINPTHRLLPGEPGWGHSEISYRDLLDFRTAASVEGSRRVPSAAATSSRATASAPNECVAGR